MSLPDSNRPSINQPWIVFPEIIGATIVAIYAPFHLAKMFMAGHIALSFLGSVCWLAGIFGTALCLRYRLYPLTFLPMLLVLGAGVLINHALFPQ